MTKKILKTLITLLVVLMMTSVMAFVVACDNTSGTSSSDSSSSSSSTTVDEHTLLNGNFEYYAEKDSITFPYKTSIKWINNRDSIISSTDYAPSSDASSGIIDTTDAKFQTLQAVTFGDSTVGTYLTVNPHSPSYYGFTQKDENMPSTSSGNRVLMIHNRVKGKAGQGTAQYFYNSGSTLTLASNEYGKLTVWVNTQGLTSEMKTNDYGAYVKLVNKVASTEVSPIIVKNINTNGEWAKVELYLEANELASANYTLYLGLGMGSEDVTTEFVEGFAFFDDITFEKIEKSDFEASTSQVTNTSNVFGVDNGVVVLDNDDIVFSLTGTTYNDNEAETGLKFSTEAFILSHKTPFNGTAYDASILEKTFNEDAFAYDGTHKTEAQNVDVDYKAMSDITLSDSKAFLDEEDNAMFEDTDKFLYFDYEEVSSSYTVQLAELTLEKDEAVLITFWAKTNVQNLNAKGLSFDVRDLGEVDASGNPIITEDEFVSNPVLSEVAEINDEANGWRMYSLLISNTDKKVDLTTGIVSKEDVPNRKFNLTVSFGPKAIKNTDKNVFPKGYALVGAFNSTKIVDEVSDLLSVTSTNSLNAEVLNSENEPTDSYTFQARENEIKAGVLSQPLATLKAYDNPETNAKPANSGIFNTEYLKSINSIALVDGADKPIIELQNPNNAHVQALAIGSAAGYYTGKSTVSANALAKVTVKLTTIGGATAYVNVLDRDSDPVDASKGYNVLTLKSDDVKTTTLIGSSPVSNDVVLSQTVTATAETDGTYKWHTVTFYIAAGTDAMNFSVEIWNGERFANAPVNGLVIVDSINVSTSDSTTFESLKAAADENGYTYTATEFGYKTFNYNENDPEEPVYVEDEDNNVKEHAHTVNANIGLTYSCVANKESTLYVNFLSTNYKDKAYVAVEDDSDTSVDTEEDSEAEDPEATDLPGETLWLTISSLVIAIVLIVVLLAVIVRMFVKKIKANRVKTSSYYDRDARDRTNEMIRSNKAKRELASQKEAEQDMDEAEDEVEEYDYDEANSIDETEETVEETVEAVEETVEAVEETETAEEAPVEENVDAEAVVEEAVEAPVEEAVEAPVETETVVEAPAETEEKKD